MSGLKLFLRAFYKVLSAIILLFCAVGLPVLLWYFVPALFPWYRLFSAIVGAVFGIGIVSRLTPPENKIFWLFFTVLSPLFSIALFLFWEGGRRGACRSNIRKSLGLTSFLSTAENGHGLFFDAAKGVFDQTGYPIMNGSVTYFSTGNAFFRAVFRSVERAKKFVFIEFFAVKQGALWHAFSELLLKKAKSGVEIRCIFDDVGCLGGVRARDCRRLQEAGVRLYYFNPLFRLNGLNRRTHRKIVVADGTDGFLCGANIADEYVKGSGKFGYWKDAGVRLSGACVRSLTVMFLQQWATQYGVESYERFFPPVQKKRGTVQVFSDSPEQFRATAKNLFLMLIHGAKREIVFSTPYLLPNDELRTALVCAIKRGVEVRIVIPAIPDKRAIYALTKQNADRLIAEGAEIFLYTPGFNHAKLFVADNNCAVVGTTNMDFRSFYLHFECNAFFHGESARTVRRDLQKMIAESERVQTKDFSVTGFGKVGRGILQIFQPLL